MKYCPFCGAVLPDEKISFCLECGEKLSDFNLHTETEKTVKKPKKEKKKSRGALFSARIRGLARGYAVGEMVRRGDFGRKCRLKEKRNFFL